MINSILRRTLLALGLAILIAAPCHAETQPEKQDDRVSLNFVNADIQEVIRAISQISKKNFLVDPRVKGTINIVSATPVSPQLGYDILLSALRLQGYAAVESNGVTQIIPEADAKQHIGSPSPGNGDKLITRVFVLKYESASQLVNLVRPIISPNSVVVAYPGQQCAGHHRLRQQREAHRKTHRFPRPAQCGCAAGYSGPACFGSRSRRHHQPPDAGSNCARGSGRRRKPALCAGRGQPHQFAAAAFGQPGRITRVKELVAQLDSATSTQGNIHVVQLKNADATKLAQTLRAVMSGDTSAAAQPSATPQGTAAQPVTSSGPSGGGIIQADVPTNALIITASEPVYNNLRSVIEKLDVRRPQIYIEALIVEVTADKASEFGVQWQKLNSANQTGNNVIGGTNFGTIQQHHRCRNQPRHAWGKA